MRRMLEITGEETVSGRRRLLGKLPPELTVYPDNNKKNVRKKDEPIDVGGPLEANEVRPQARRSIKRRQIPAELFDPFTGALIITTKGPKDKFSVEQVEVAIINARGYITFAARQLGCSPEYIRGVMKRHPRVDRLVGELLEARLDLAEDTLDKVLSLGDLDAIKYFLDRKGKSRGYGKEEQKGPKTINIKIVPAPASPHKLIGDSIDVPYKEVTVATGTPEATDTTQTD